ncbi:MAG: heavy metal translocating P-type ATPase [Longimicrobiales bacterium]
MDAKKSRAVTSEATAACTLDVSGMDCSSCADTVEKALRHLEGVEDVRVDVLGGRVVVRYAEGKLARGDLAGAINRVGYGAKEVRGASRSDAQLPGEEHEEPSWWDRHGRLILAAVSGVLWVSSLVAGPLLENESAAAALAVGAMVTGGWYIIPRGIRAAMNRALDMNFLMSIAAVGALFIGEYEEAASALFLFAVAQLLETYSMDRARNAIKALMELSPAEATVLRDGREERVPADRVEVGELVVVRPGEKIAVDGEIVSGRSSVNQAPITGESIPVDKEAGEEVFAGTLNGEGALEVRSSKPASDTTLARIIHSVEEAQASRAPSQTFVDRFARVYTPIVVLTAFAVFLLPPLLGFGAWGEWFYRALVLLVVACPCALVISTPVTVVSALAGSARRGILIKGGLHLENAGRATIVALDKTGTLTEGQPEVVDVVALNGASSTEVLELAAAAEARSEHPLARAVLRYAEEQGVVPAAASETSAAVGRGVVSTVDGRKVYVGSERLFSELSALDASMVSVLKQFNDAGRTAVLVGVSNDSDMPPEIRGAIAIADRVRPNASAALAALHGAGIERIVMLTGDNEATARAVADALGQPGVNDVRAGLLPADKVTAIEDMRRGGARVIMVGDGVNDAPALAAADVGVAMGSAGTDVALETADIALMADDLSKLSETVRFARKAESIIRTNIAFAILTKAAFVVLAVAGVATLWMAVLADMGASLIVIANGIRALRIS